MIFYHASVMLMDASGESADDDLYTTNEAEAHRYVRKMLAEDEGSATIYRFETVPPNEVGGVKKFTLMLLNRRGYVRSSETVAEYRSEVVSREWESDDPYARKVEKLKVERIR